VALFDQNVEIMLTFVDEREYELGAFKMSWRHS
jgi:hypothetical protein